MIDIIRLHFDSALKYNCPFIPAFCTARAHSSKKSACPNKRGTTYSLTMLLIVLKCFVRVIFPDVHAEVLTDLHWSAKGHKYNYGNCHPSQSKVTHAILLIKTSIQ